MQKQGPVLHFGLSPAVPGAGGGGEMARGEELEAGQQFAGLSGRSPLWELGCPRPVPSASPWLSGQWMKQLSDTILPQWKLGA